VDLSIQSRTVFWTVSGGVGVDPDGSRSHLANGSLMKAALLEGPPMFFNDGAPQRLASGLPVPVAIAVDEANVYWAQGGYDLAPASVMRMPVAGGDAVRILSATLP
jgi:hypothetical protein